jgi:CubicO group peptidase (beta-lactamase class C family)
MSLRTDPRGNVDALDALLALHAGSRYSAAVVRIERGGTVVYERATGRMRDDAGAAVAVDTRFDLASITKVVVATVALRAVMRGELALDEPLGTVIPAWARDAHAPVTLRMILAHTAGFRSGADYRTLFAENVESFALTLPPVAAPGERVIYSDLGFIALGVVLARCSGMALRTLVERETRLLGAAGLSYGTGAREAVPATERDAWRGLVHGTVHDEKAHLAGGVAGHAGLFGNARDVARIAELYLAAVRGRPTLLDPGLALAAVSEQAGDPVLRRGLGWALKTSDENSCGPRMSPATFGHTGFTGTSVWVDPVRDLSVTLLTNAVHYGRRDLRDVRAAVCDAAVAAFGA